MRRWCTAVLVSAAPFGVISHEEAPDRGALRGRGLTEAEGWASQPGAAEFPVDSHHTCSGMETNWDVCPNLPSCNNCVPTNCVFATWGEWGDAPVQCTGLCIRTRQVGVPNNKCGEPCKGPTSETKNCAAGLCPDLKSDCVLGAWRTWSPCENPDTGKVVLTGQSTRTRMVTSHAAHGGLACNASLKKSQPCGFANAVDCQTGDWNPWTACSASCGTNCKGAGTNANTLQPHQCDGHRTRIRAIKRRGMGVGKPCGASQEEGKCTVELQCVTTNCAVGPWTAWSGCNSINVWQESRERAMIGESSVGGVQCNTTLKELQPCSYLPRDCVMNDWAPWGACDKSCEGGQKTRLREIVAPSKNGGKCSGGSTSELMGCNSQACIAPGAQNCQLSAWNEWATCSNSCGIGEQGRKRKIQSIADPGFDGCGSNLNHEVLEESRECNEMACLPMDCKWGNWGEWDHCDAHCDGGSHRRSREVATLSAHGGATCDTKSKEEAEPCNTLACVLCIDGEWASWEAWSSCSVTCDNGYKSRHRVVAQAPSECGKPAAGSTTELTACSQDSCTKLVDCEFSSWEDWSTCSSTCFGNRERKRSIPVYVEGAGVACSGAMQEIGPCFQDTEDKLKTMCQGAKASHDCELGDWSSWSTCTLSSNAKQLCGTGQKNRHRGVVSPIINNGEACKAAESETVGCEVNCQDEECTDCGFKPWSDWSDCRTVGWPHRDGLRKRSRVGVMQSTMANCGIMLQCPLGSHLEESEACRNTTVSLVSCDWSSWEAKSECHKESKEPAKEPTKECHKTRYRRRQLNSFSYIPGDPSKISDGDFYGTSFNEICKRDNDYHEVETLEACEECSENACMPHDLIMAPWTAWEQQVLWTSEGTMCSRERKKKQDKNTCGSYVGLGSFAESKSCDARVNWTSCSLGGWEPWDAACDNVHVQPFRSRKASKNFPDECLGFTQDAEGSTGELREAGSCKDKLKQPQDCKAGNWSSWTQCLKSSTCREIEQRTRNVTNAQDGGQGCDGESTLQGRERTSCVCAASAIHGNVSFSLFCKGATKHASTFSGKPSATTQCSAYCASQIGCVGHGFNTATSKCIFYWVNNEDCLKQCSKYPFNGKYDSAVGVSWKEKCEKYTGDVKFCAAWNEQCDTSCSGAHEDEKTLCDGDLADCDKQSCDEHSNEPWVYKKDCKSCLQDNDCKFGSWSAPIQPVGSWSATGGLYSSSSSERQFVLPVSYTGKWIDAPCVGAMKEYTSTTSGPQDCHMPDWTEWSTCNKTCVGGFSERTRTPTHADQGAKQCDDASMLEVRSCNDKVFCTADGSAPTPQNCSLADWGTWSPCSVTCGEGTETRTRDLKTLQSWAPSAQTEGCAGTMSESKVCGNSEACSNKCIISDWAEWSECTRTCEGGQRSRVRDPWPITQYPHGGGDPCKAFSGEEVDSCNVYTCPTNCTKVDAKWSEWTYGECSATCAGGFVSRHRSVVQNASCGGEPALGLSEGVLECNSKVPCIKDIACIFKEWMSWSGCTPGVTDPCMGMKNRSRSYFPKVGHGLPCAGSVKEESACSPSWLKSTCFPAPEADCKFTDWTLWSECDATCDGGQSARNRSTMWTGSSSKPCTGSTEERKPCNTFQCPGIKDCQYSDWIEWSSCQSCAGQRSRQRQVAVFPQNGGEPCQAGMLEETGTCSRNCNRLFCGWADWREWSECTQKCGTGKRSRTRILGLVERPPPAPSAAAQCLDFNGVHHLDGKTCCALACGTKYCGTNECQNGPGGPNACCASFIPASQVCSGTQKAPCTLQDSPPTIAGLWDARQDDLEDRVQELYRRTTSGEVNRRGELFLAFGLGAVSLLALAAISSTVGPCRRPQRMSRVVSHEDRQSSTGLRSSSVQGHVLSRSCNPDGSRSQALL